MCQTKQGETVVERMQRNSKGNSFCVWQKGNLQHMESLINMVSSDRLMYHGRNPITVLTDSWHIHRHGQRCLSICLY